MTQIVEALNRDDLADVAAKREWVQGYYEPHAQHKYGTVEGKLDLIDTILENRWVTAEDTLKLQCLGITFGDALAQHMELAWVAVEDEYGRDPALQLEGTTVLVFPMTSISKRVERGETVDVHDLFNGTCDIIRRAARDSA